MRCERCCRAVVTDLPAKPFLGLRRRLSRNEGRTNTDRKNRRSPTFPHKHEMAQCMVQKDMRSSLSPHAHVGNGFCRKLHCSGIVFS